MDEHLEEDILVFFVSLGIDLFRELDHRLEVDIGLLLLWHEARRRVRSTCEWLADASI